MYKQLQSSQRTYLYIVFIAILANLMLATYIYKKTQSLKTLRDQLNQQYVAQITISQTISNIERDLGYVGFIHHFKNFVIRRDLRYFERARDKYLLLKSNIYLLQTLITDTQLKANVDQLNATLEEYYQKLLKARQIGLEKSVTELDNIVKVDDTPALIALTAMQNSVLPKVDEILNSSKDKLEQINLYMWLFNLLLFPLIIVTTWFILRAIKRSHFLLQELGEIFDVSPDGILYIDHQGHILGANKMACQLFQYSNQEMKQLSVEDLLDPALKDKHRQYRDQFQTKQQSRLMTDTRQKIMGLTKYGDHVEVQIAISSTTIGNEPRTICVIRDMSEQNALKQVAELDYLTHLHNRRSIDQLLFKELARSERNQAPVSLLLIDLDNFKQVNDELGHAEGDEILTQVANFLRENTRTYDSIGRWGGDEFVLISPELHQQDALNYATRLIESFRASPIGNGQLSLSIGVATHTPDCPYDLNTLFEHADQALYTSKQRGKAQATHIKDLELEK
ncbi:sensor domain-containing diguanylate cyclase [Vibrio sp. JPW-9-11-11]|uniref:sensor domain-containing diguanylate cyclase n=1 Tax=Vibrio sp. JPW-9-11-11 TaxID=1416532 RepID=UPI0015937637|nr:sensor domain-containing diguanylate cyclase [Vibrio sp. JPW-9-11-11]